MRVISRMTEVLSFPRKRESRIKRVWIPSQAGNDNACDFEDDRSVVIPAKAGIQD
jgi:hypothetical protein